MGSSMNFESIAGTAMGQPEGNIGRTASILPLARESSIYSMTFDELQTLSGLGKDLGSMNMEDLIKNIWTAEDTQGNPSTPGVTVNVPVGNLQRQGSLSLPRTLSQRTVDEVWKDLLKESTGTKDVSGSGISQFGQREPTLGEMTLEEFLARAGLVREDPEPMRPPNFGLYGNMASANGNANGLAMGFQQPAQNHGLFGSQIGSNSTGFSNSSNLVLNGGVVRSSQQHQQAQQQQPLFPKQAHVTFASPQLGNNVQQMVNGVQLSSPRANISGVSMANSTIMPAVAMTNSSANSTIIPAGPDRVGVMSIAGLRCVTTTVAGGSPGNHVLPDTISKSSLDSPSLSPSPYPFSETGRGRRSNGTLEKQVERRRRRMIKNRESAARSRARKQAYTLELEAEIAKLKETNQELERKQVELVEMQKNKILETLKMPWADTRRCLRRTLTGPW